MYTVPVLMVIYNDYTVPGHMVVIYIIDYTLPVHVVVKFVMDYTYFMWCYIGNLLHCTCPCGDYL